MDYDQESRGKISKCREFRITEIPPCLIVWHKWTCTGTLTNRKKRDQTWSSRYQRIRSGERRKITKKLRFLSILHHSTHPNAFFSKFSWSGTYTLITGSRKSSVYPEFRFMKVRLNQGSLYVTRMHFRKYLKYVTRVTNTSWKFSAIRNSTKKIITITVKHDNYFY